MLICCYSESVNGQNLSKSLEELSLGQIVALVTVNRCIKFLKICFNTFKLISKVKVCHNGKDNYFFKYLFNISL